MSKGQVCLNVFDKQCAEGKFICIMPLRENN